MVVKIMDIAKIAETLSKIKGLAKEIQALKERFEEMHKLYSEVQLFIDQLKNL